MFGATASSAPAFGRSTGAPLAASCDQKSNLKFEDVPGSIPCKSVGDLSHGMFHWFSPDEHFAQLAKCMACLAESQSIWCMGSLCFPQRVLYSAYVQAACPDPDVALQAAHQSLHQALRQLLQLVGLVAHQALRQVSHQLLHLVGLVLAAAVQALFSQPHLQVALDSSSNSSQLQQALEPQPLQAGHILHACIQTVFGLL